MIRDFVRNGDSVEVATSKCLHDLSDHFATINKSLADFGFPLPDHAYDEPESGPAEYVMLSNSMRSNLNQEQALVYEAIMSAVNSMLTKAKCFFIDGPGGTGKTYLYIALINRLKSEGKRVIATATTGIAALIMPDGRTAHSKIRHSISYTPSHNIVDHHAIKKG